ncbi:nucleoside deaminase [Mameliella sediminis]|uniref:nucleoside deaminase n=1 Tax=Mameliella sediminis TaxID=2836866 RepID=UPI001C4703FE|nr:nucleoside deaminase [Mameliella sediminis]MBV7395927.1 nucleoside deaminase [Mameliella sediminis]
MISGRDQAFMAMALEQATTGFDQGGFPVGAVLTQGDHVVSRGHNLYAQDKDPTAHGEMVCLRGAYGAKFEETTLYTTLSPCIMCSGTILWLGIRRVVIGDAVNYTGNEEMLRGKGIAVDILDDPGCKALFARFLERSPDHGFPV